MLSQYKNISASLFFLLLCTISNTFAGTTDGDLSMSIVAPYNLIVDSNAESPSTYAPKAAHFGVEICNTGSDAITDIEINIGDYVAAPSTPGIYRTRTVSQGGYSGTFSLTHVGSSSDATRTRTSLAAGACVVEYWLVEYPSLDGSGNSVTGGSKPDDDLWLEFDIWVTGDDNGTARSVDGTKRVTMRSEISAMANKIYPNGDNKVPQEYLDAIESVLGWRPNSSNSVGDVSMTEGIWFDLGRINQGFDNDGDYVPDYNVFLQPVGDPDLYDPNFFRLIKIYGLLIVKRTDGTEELIPFEDQTYFSNINPDNNGAVGLVYYEFAILNAPCTINLTPYQEVASGRDNEKFNGDFGVFTGSITSTPPSASLTESGPASANHDSDITYIVSGTNSGSTSLGLLDFDLPVVLSTTIPEGTNYVAGSAATSGALPTGATTITIKYSTDNGATWTTTEPGDPTTVTNIQWWMDTTLEAGETLNTTFKVQAPSSTYTDPVVINESGMSLGNNAPFLTDDVLTLLPGLNSIGDLVFEDNGAGGGTTADGIQNGTEAGISGIPVYLFYDLNGDGELDADDIALDTATTNGSGAYSFTNLADANYIVQLCKSCVTGGGNHDGWGITTADIQNVSVDTAHADASAIVINNIDFGFTPALSVTKTITSSTPAYEGQEITYNLTVNNLLVANPGGVCDFGTETVRDEFTTQSYSRNDGSSNWASDWIESGESDGPVLGNFYVHSTALRLVIGDIGYVYREVDLSCATTATLSFIHRTQSGSGQMTLDISNDNGSTWQNVATYSMGTTESSGTAVSYDIMAYRATSGNTLIRFAHDGGSGIKSFDDVQVEYAGNGESSGGSGGSSPCTYDLWINQDGNANFLPSSALFGVPDDTYASDSWGASIYGGSFTVPSSSDNITKVEVVAKTYYLNSIVDDVWEITLTENGSTNLNTVFTIPTSAFSAFNSQANAGEISVDITSEKTNWSWSDFSATQSVGYGMRLNAAPTSGSDNATAYVDAVGFRITTDGNCSSGSTAFDPLSGLSIVPLQDVYNPDSLEYVSASITPTSVNEVTGIISWDNIGPLGAGDSKSISVTFKVKEPNNNTTGSTTNTAIVSNAFFGSGDAANTDTSRITVTTEPTGTLSGFVWSDTNGNGWQGTNGYDVGEGFVANAAVVLHSCTSVAPNGSCNGTELTYTTYTDANGAYQFEGLVPNLHYYIEILESSLPGTVSETGDPDDDPNRGSGNGNTCGNGGSNAACDANWDNDGDWFEIGVDSWGGESWDIANINFGYIINPSIYGNIWNDVDGDGVQETGELGMNGVSIELQTAFCTPGVSCLTTTTDADGNYSFVNLSAGIEYTIVTTAPSGSASITAESDGTTNNSISITPASGEVSGSHDFAYHTTGTASIGDLVYYDFNGDGTQDASDEGIPNVVLNLYEDINSNGAYDPATDAFVGTTTTDAAGAYQFANLPAGDYMVIIDEGDVNFPSNVSQTGDADETGTCSTCDGLAEQTLTTTAVDTIDFGYAPFGTASIGDLVWKDVNGDNTQLGTVELGLPNISVELWGDFNNDGTYVMLTSTTTDANGNYLFSSLADGSYQVIVDSTDTDLPTDGSGNLFSNTANSIYTATITNGQVDIPSNCTDCPNAVDFGFAALPSIGNMVFWDDNGNGTQDESEPGVEGVTVYLCSGSVGSCTSGNAIASTTTSDGTDGNPAGFYQFAGLQPGDYTIGVETSSGTLNGIAQTADPNSDGLACDDPQRSSLGYPACDNVYGVTVSYGVNVTGADFGYQPTGVLGDQVWMDLDNDGVKDNNEPGIGLVEITLTNQTAVTIDGTPYAPGAYVVIDSTDLDGNYSFSNLPDGTWTVAATPPANRTAVYDADGSSDNTTSIIISGGAVSSGSNGWCASADCSLDIDFGYQLSGSNTISGVICLDDGSGDGTCGTGGETMISGIFVNLYTSTGEFIGQVVADGSGAYSFGQLPNDTYIISISTSISPLDIAELTTTAAVTPATSITETTNTVYQTVTVSANTSGVDFAFNYTVDIDFGDLPTPYLTSYKSNEVGAYHILDPSPTLYLGSLVDSESEPTLTASSDGDDTTGQGDEDGINFIGANGWTVGDASSGEGGSLEATASASGWLVGWIDFNNDGDLSDPGEMIISQALSAGTTAIDFDIPTGTNVNNNTVYSRFRLFESEPAFPQFSYSGEAINGEVEDYQFVIGAPLPVELSQLEVAEDGCDMQISWTIESHEAFSHFELEYSTDGEDFEYLTTNDIEQSVYRQAFQYLHTESTRNNYYRLKMIDLDGAYTYSKVIYKENECLKKLETKISLYPNPIGIYANVLTVRTYSEEAGMTKIAITDMQGRAVRVMSLPFDEGWMTVRINTAGLPAGSYFYTQARKDGRIVSEKFIIQE